MPAGVAQEDLGKCDHALSVVGNPNAYEVGVVRQAGGNFALRWDFFQGGYGLQACVGQGANRLKQRYAAEVAAKMARRQGMTVAEHVGADGKIRLVCRS